MKFWCRNSCPKDQNLIFLLNAVTRCWQIICCRGCTFSLIKKGFKDFLYVTKAVSCFFVANKYLSEISCNQSIIKSPYKLSTTYQGSLRVYILFSTQFLPRCPLKCQQQIPLELHPKISGNIGLLRSQADQVTKEGRGRIMEAESERRYQYRRYRKK